MEGLRVFVTQELYPFTAGGIGRVLGNILATSTKAELESTAIVYFTEDGDLSRFRSFYPGVQFVAATNAGYLLSEGGHEFLPEDAYKATHPLHLKSVIALQALRRLQYDRGPLAYVEFTDWGGIAFASCQEKKLGRDFALTTLAVRLHSTDSLLSAVEQRWTDLDALALYDLERKALADCDIVVGQLAPVAERVRAFYGFDEADWQSRLRIHAPPVLLDGQPLVEVSLQPALDTPITFTSKIQHLKRPEVFVAGCVKFLLARPAVTSPVYLLAHAFDQQYLEQIKALIPASLASRFQFVKGLSGAPREKLIAGSVCAFPSVYESFCLAAYEASLTGALCLVNAGNPAFGEGTPWRPGENCVGFDGSVDGLARALEEAFFSQPRHVPARVPKDTPPWQQACDAQTGAPEPKRITAVVAHANRGLGLMATIDSLVASSHPDLEIVVVDSASTEAVASSVLTRLADSGLARLRVERAEVAMPLGALFNRGAALATGEHILFLEAGDTVSPRFAANAAAALDVYGAYDIVTAQAARSGDRDLVELAPGSRYGRYAVCLGEARMLGLYANLFSTPVFAVRASTFARTRFSEDSDVDAAWDYHFRAVSEGLRYVVSTSVDIVRHQLRADFVELSEQASRLKRHGVLRNKRARIGSTWIPLYMMEATGVQPEIDSSIVDELTAQLDEYRKSETVFAALTVARALDRRAPWLLRAIKWNMRATWHAVNLVRPRHGA